jgi:hydroxyacylglutathione hydrolase
MQILPYQARSDNWMYLVIDDVTQEAAVVDPYDAEKISKAAKEKGVKVSGDRVVEKRPMSD